MPGKTQSNQVGEVAAVVVALQDTPNFAPLEIVTDSKYTIDGLTKHLPKWEDRGWIGIKNSELFRAAAYQLRKRSATTHFRWVKGHSGNEGNERADKLAGEGAQRDQPDELDLRIPPEFDPQGARLVTITQATAYAGIRARKKKPERKLTTYHLELT